MKKPKKNITLDELAGMVAGGFEEMGERFNRVETDIKDLKDGQKQIGLKLDNVACRFELVELQRRVDILEKRVGISHR